MQLYNTRNIRYKINVKIAKTKCHCDIIMFTSVCSTELVTQLRSIYHHASLSSISAQTIVLSTSLILVS